MDKDKKNDILVCAGDLEREFSELKKLSEKSNDEIITLTIDCSAFFTMICCWNVAAWERIKISAPYYFMRFSICYMPRTFVLQNVIFGS